MEEKYINAIRENHRQFMKQFDCTDEAKAQLETEIDCLQKKLKDLGVINLRDPIYIPYSLLTDYSNYLFKKEKQLRCKGCLFLSKYCDMDMISNMCIIVEDLALAIETTTYKEPCPNKLTYQEAVEYVKNRGTNNH